ncbi:metal ABC transporter solute-binding protein, Zn/Mn family [Paenactinomyces guangxiensis]|uniref:Zinc ABC transporter substrate-binding protein n=1 Tax=Paenactinomyces guangxiensis TaxID=1490290 RepID=A0A7W2A754_9BACL|nr:zinc ABC transporter substrate-binding protein [Paenactinomyces guangxiensis]MBA4494161.1 zinc ABC transporter substrate-binding protein [Paenactinomyces guangxiensis]MBH8591094.1 zinc ABC transporter substrate-binding protein [Paenactinomyces guangxiensis]
MSKRIVGWVAVMLLAVTALAGCGSSTTATKKDDSKLQIYTSLYPLEDFAKKIGGNHVQVTNLVPPGTESHDFELSARDMANLSEADVFIYNGAGFEPWVEKAVQSLDQDQTVIVNSTEKMDLIPVTGQEHDHSHEKGKHPHDRGNFDPHVWMDPTLAKQEALKIRDALIKADPTHKADYEKNYSVLADQFDQLDQEYMEMVKKAPRKEFVVSHAAFGYLAKRYGLQQIAVSGITPSDEPSPRELQEIIETVRKHDVKVILFETLVSGKVAEVVKKEVKAEALTLNPLEGLTKEELDRGDDYFSVMRKNKAHLARALGAANE